MSSAEQDAPRVPVEVGPPHPRSEDPRRFVRPALRNLSAYHLDLSTCRHKLDQNEVPYDLPRHLKERIAARWLAEDWARYPDFHADDLRAALGRLHDWPQEGVLAGNGSGELLSLVLEAVTRSGHEVLGCQPSFGLYRMFVLRAGGMPRFLGPSDDLSLPLAALAAEVRRDPRRTVLLCSPNNPTGDAATPEAVEGLLEALDAPLLLDNAYGEFCRHDYRPLLARHRNLILFRTFSKAWSLGGQRLGYLLADPDLVHELIKVKLPYNLSRASAAAGEVVLAARASLQRRVRLVLARRRQWAAMLAAFGFEVFPSEANFLLVRRRRAEAIRLGLVRRSIQVRDVSKYPGLATCLRFSVGAGPALRAVARALAEIMKEEGEERS